MDVYVCTHVCNRVCEWKYLWAPGVVARGQTLFVWESFVLFSAVCPARWPSTSQDPPGSFPTSPRGTGIVSAHTIPADLMEVLGIQIQVFMLANTLSPGTIIQPLWVLPCGVKITWTMGTILSFVVSPRSLLLGLNDQFLPYGGRTEWLGIWVLDADFMALGNLLLKNRRTLHK